jgi:class 3 adenylate cyclase
MEAPPETLYALRDELHVGYQVWGSGPVDILEFNNGLMISIDETIDEPNWLRYTESLASFSRLIRFDCAGLGLSDPLPTAEPPTMQGWVDDALAVLDAAGVEKAVLLSSTGGCMPAMLLASQHPERVISLVLVNGTARVGRTDDYEVGVDEEEIGGITDGIEMPAPEDEEVPRDIAIFVPSLAHRIGFKEWWVRGARRGASPSTAIAFNILSFSADVRECLPSITCPTLVMSRTDCFANLLEHGRYLSEHITGARFVTFPGPDMLPWAGEFESIVSDIEEFVTGTRSGQAPQRTLATVLFTDIVDSTQRAAAVGDRQWRLLMDEFDFNVQRLVDRYDGVHVKNTGDGSLSRFPSPAQGVRCAVDMVEAAKHAGLEIRAGLHAGEIELRGDDIVGLAVHIASRVSALAGAGEVLTTGTVRDLVVGSGIVFDDRGRHNLKGVPDEWQLLAVEKA